MDTVAMVAGTGLNKDVVQVRSAEDAAAVRTRVTRLLHRPLSADAAVQIALLNNLGLQAAYNRLGIAEALAVKASRPPALSFSLLGRLDPGRARHRAQSHRQPAVARSPCRRAPGSRPISSRKPSFAPRRRPCGSRRRRGALMCARSRPRRSWRRSAKPRQMPRLRQSLPAHLKQTGAVNKLDQARRQVFATEMDAELVGAPPAGGRGAREAHAAHGALAHRSRRLSAKRPAALAGLDAERAGPSSRTRSNARVDVQMARLEMEAMAKSYGLTRKTHFLNVLDAAGISKTQKDKGEKRADGGGYELVLEVPLFDFGKANVREAEQRYLEAANRLGQLGVNAASEAREAYGAYRATYAIARKYEGEVLPLAPDHLGGDRAAI